MPFRPDILEQKPGDCQKFKTQSSKDSPEHTLKNKTELVNKYGNGMKVDDEHEIRENFPSLSDLDYKLLIKNL